MAELLYLLVALALSALGTAVLWWRHQRPPTLGGTIDEFSRGLSALAPDERRRRHRGRSRATRVGRVG